MDLSGLHIAVGERVFLALHVPENLLHVHAWYNDPDIQQLSAGGAAVVSLEASRCRLERWMNPPSDQRHWAIHRLTDGRLLGFLHLVAIDFDEATCKVGIVIGEKDCWGYGYGGEAVRLACEYAFRERDVFRVSAEVLADNLRSHRMLSREGFILEGLQRAAATREGTRVDVSLFGRLKTDNRTDSEQAESTN